MRSVRIDRSKRLSSEPETGHNRWHPDIPPILEVDPGEDVLLETRDASDGQVETDTVSEQLAFLDTRLIHPLTGPVSVKGARPGDLLEVEYLEIQPARDGWTYIRPGAGFLTDLFPDPYLVNWRMEDAWAISPQLPGVRIPRACFMGTAGVAPSAAQVEAWTLREKRVLDGGGSAILPNSMGAVPNIEPIASTGLRTIPPRENCGNLDAKQLTAGSKLLIPVNVEGALFSVGDAHFAQGDGECCVTAIEMGAAVVLRFSIYAQSAARQRMRYPRFSHPNFFAPPEFASPRDFVATVGLPIQEDGGNVAGDVTLAARNALIEMIALLQAHGWSQQQAYVICSVAVDLRITNCVNLPNVAVSALLPRGIFDRAIHGWVDDR